MTVAVLKTMRMFAVRALALIVVGCALGFAVNAVRADGLRFAAFAAPVSCTQEHTAMPVEILAPTEAVTLCGDPGVLVADARSAARFQQGHVANAVHLPCSASGRVASAALALLNGKHTVVVYGDTTEEAQPVAESLRQRADAPRVKVIVLGGGFPAWNAAGLACSSGDQPADPNTSTSGGSNGR